jgi:hypothetical protein
MATIKVCDLDGQAFIERSPGSVVIERGYIYNEQGKAEPFAGEFCPPCGASIQEKRKMGVLALPILPADYQDHEE